MRLDVFVHFEPAPADRRFDTILSLLQRLITQGEKMAADLTALEAQVKANTDAEESAVQVLTQLHDMLVAAQGDPARVQAVIDQLGASKDKLAAAIVASTPVA